MATSLTAPTEDSKVLAPADPRLLACFSSSDYWRALVTMAGKLAIPGNAAVHVCYKDLANQPATDGTTFSSLGIAARLIFLPRYELRGR